MQHHPVLDRRAVVGERDRRTGSAATMSGVKEAFAPLVITNDDARAVVAFLGGGQIEPNARPRRRRTVRAQRSGGSAP